MKKILLVCCVLSASGLNINAVDRYDEVGYMTIKYGVTSITDNFALKQHTFAFDFIGDIGHGIKPKFDFSYVNVNESDSVDYLLQGSLNGYLKTNIENQDFSPYYYGGLGYEYVGGGRGAFDDSFYFQVGVGLDIGIASPSDDLHLVTEFRFLQLVGSNDGQDNEATFFIGLKLPLGETLARYGYNESYYEPVEAASLETYPELSGDAESVEPTINYNIRERRDSNSLISDRDGDEVDDVVDECPNTPTGHFVNDSGCSIGDGRVYIENSKPIVTKRRSIDRGFVTTTLPKKRKVLNIHFELNSDRITSESRDIIRAFVESVNMTSYSGILVEGYTDSTGSFQSNVRLSQRRANSVRNLMVQYGIDSTDIQATGKGAVSPIANNETPEGRADNRRIELVVTP